MKLAIFDMDGTLFDTTEVNYKAYKFALNEYGYDLHWDYFREQCNGKNYKEFLKPIIGSDEETMEQIHVKKKEVYFNYLNCAKCNENLLEIVRTMKSDNAFYTAIVTTASKKNCMELLMAFKVDKLFDLILTQEDIEYLKPNPQGFEKAMEFFEVSPEDTIIFEDSEIGLEAAKYSKANYIKVYGFN